MILAALTRAMTVVLLIHATGKLNTRFEHVACLSIDYRFLPRDAHATHVYGVIGCMLWRIVCLSSIESKRLTRSSILAGFDTEAAFGLSDNSLL